ncbi:DUF4236 domain-containing protein [Flavobacterium sp. J49]|uniref:DUF4236 domain-containing protein n=1 Tax=Flavobacterium sp. J49 TaxID=2718534 RepID=UPI0015934E6D|nr:DUF4236 domain-containing protein [Flavobacterium sp. J49]NIC03400.1 DUF4236 domain-containing protein [Flavobacterium sp. J49]
MGFRFSKRINIGKGFGFNISKSGISPSVRTKLGSFSTKGYSLKTGVPGLTYRKTANSKGCLFLIIILIIFGISFYQLINIE